MNAYEEIWFEERQRRHEAEADRRKKQLDAVETAIWSTHENQRQVLDALRLARALIHFHNTTVPQ